MKANELRIGNYIKWGDFTQTVESISKEYLTCNPLEAERNISEFEPIPLTEEWLLKFGFDFDGYNEFTKDTLLLDNEYTDRGEWNLILKGANIKALESKHEYVCHYVPKSEIKYVHQLQNLYFALTGEELA